MNRFMKKTSILIIILTMLVGILNISIAKEYIEIPSNGDISGDITILPIEPGKDDIIIYPGDGDSNGGSNNSGSTNAGNKENTQGTEEVTTNVDKVKNFTNSDTMGNETLNRYMPSKNTEGSTGLLPQYSSSNTKGRIVTLENSRYDLNNGMWAATIDGEIIYCAKKGSYVRYGFFEDGTKYPVVDNFYVQGYKITLSGQTIESIATDPNYSISGIANSNPYKLAEERRKRRF